GASMGITSVSDSLILLSASTSPPTNPFLVNGNFTVVTNALYEVDLSTHAGTVSGASASADLGPVNITAPGYTLDFSPNMVPEPSCVLMIGGALCVALRRRSQPHGQTS